MSTFLTIMTLHLATSGVGVWFIYRRGVTPVSFALVAAWIILFFPVAYNVMTFFSPAA